MVTTIEKVEGDYTPEMEIERLEARVKELEQELKHVKEMEEELDRRKKYQ